jgi:hypothetical protein
MRRIASMPGRASISSGFSGMLQVDGYGAYRELASAGAVELAFCWAHVRRYFYDLQASGTPAPIASEALARIAPLYAVETACRGQSAEQRRHMRQLRSKPIIEALKPWFERQLGLVSGKSKLTDVLTKIVARHPMSRIDDFLPFAYVKPKALDRAAA